MTQIPNKNLGGSQAPGPAAKPIAAPKQPEVLEPGQTAKHSKQGQRIKVEATAVGYIEDCRRRIGDVFTVPQEAFSEAWMKRAGPEAREHTTDAATALKREQHAMAGGGQREVVPDDDDDVFGKA